MKTLLDPKDSTGEYPFKWVDSRSTDIRRTFEKYRNAAPQADAKPLGADVNPSSAAAAPNIQSLSLWRKA